MKTVRNISSVVIGIAVYIVLTVIFSIILSFLSKLPLLSFVFSGYVSLGRWIACTIPFFATIIAHKTVKCISIYDDVNYSIVITFSIIAGLSVCGAVIRIFESGFSLYNLINDIIAVGFAIFGICACGKEDDLTE